jgi:hypothetical protein
MLQDMGAPTAPEPNWSSTHTVRGPSMVLTVEDAARWVVTWIVWGAPLVSARWPKAVPLGIPLIVEVDTVMSPVGNAFELPGPHVESASGSNGGRVTPVPVGRTPMPLQVIVLAVLDTVHTVIVIVVVARLAGSLSSAEPQPASVSIFVPLVVGDTDTVTVPVVLNSKSGGAVRIMVPKPTSAAAASAITGPVSEV